MALLLAAEDPRILENPDEVIHELKPAQLAELWVYAGGEHYGWPKEVGSGDIAFSLSHYEVNVNVTARDCAKSEPLDFADCQRFSLDAHELHQEIDLRSGISVGEISDLLSAFMTQMEEAYPEGPDF